MTKRYLVMTVLEQFDHTVTRSMHDLERAVLTARAWADADPTATVQVLDTHTGLVVASHPIQE